MLNTFQMVNLQRVASLLLYLVLTLACVFLTVEVGFNFLAILALIANNVVKNPKIKCL